MSTRPGGDPPDVLALPLDEARAQLEAAGYTVAVQETAPPRRGAPRGSARVVRQEAAGSRVTLVVTHERYERPAALSAGQ